MSPEQYRAVCPSLLRYLSQSFLSLCGQECREGGIIHRGLQSLIGMASLFLFTIILFLVYIHYRNPRFQYDISVQAYSELRSYLP